jgi:protocatechuate 3,4-dioxygenase beta subunit
VVVACSERSPTTAPSATLSEAIAPSAQAQTLSPTPAICEDALITPAQTAGPYFTPNSPERTSLLEAGMMGTQIVVTGQVLSRNCIPVAHALLDFWHADNDGVYDNIGYHLRGHQFADEMGRFSLATIVPGIYPGRTRHFHVKVQAPNQPILTTQLYFPNELLNQRDRLFQEALLLTLQDSGNGQRASFNFVLDVG